MNSTTDKNVSEKIFTRAFKTIAYGSSMKKKARLKVYLFVFIIAQLFIWVPISLFLIFAPTTYTSKWTLILPGAGSGSAINLESIGHATTSTVSPYQSSSVDPRENYKAIILSDTVMSLAAASLNMKREQFVKPKIKLLDQTALMQFSLSAIAAKEAQDKAYAIHNAFQSQVELLRKDQIVKKEEGLQKMLNGFSKKLTATQKKILDYQSKTGLVSLDQYKEVVLSIENLRRTQTEVSSEYAGIKAKVSRLAKNLGVTPKLAADALLLSTNDLYRNLLTEYSEATTLLSEYRGKWGENHPLVAKQFNRQQASYAELKRHSKKVVGYSNEKLINILSLDKSDSRSGLFRDLVSYSADSAGIKQKLKKLEEHITNKESNLEASTYDAVMLEDLHRKHQVATAVFTTALAKQDIGKADIFAAYPLTQLLAPPSLPEKSDSLRNVLAFVGGLLASIFILLGLIILWIRKPFLRKILKKM